MSKKSPTPQCEEEKTDKEVIIRADESYTKLSQFLKDNPTREKLERFMQENPGLVIVVPSKQVRKAHQRLEKRMKDDPVGRLILEADKKFLLFDAELKRRQKNK